MLNTPVSSVHHPFIVDSWEIFGPSSKGFNFHLHPPRMRVAESWVWASVISDVSKSVWDPKEKTLSSWLAAVNLLTWITHSSYTTDQSEAPDGCMGTNQRPGLRHDTTLIPGLEIMFSKFSHDIQWFEYSGKWRLLEASLNGQIIGLSNFFHRKLLLSGVLRVNLSNFS